MVKEPANNFLAASEGNYGFLNDTLSAFGVTKEGAHRRFKYRMTNSNIPIVRSLMGDLSGKSILAVSGSSVNLFSMLDGGIGTPKRVVGFDMSPKQIAYNCLVRGAFRDLSWKEFLNYFGYTSRSSRSYDDTKVRAKLVSTVHPTLRSYLPYRHSLTVRDKKIATLVGCSFVSNEQAFMRIKQNVNLVRFFIFNLNPLLPQNLAEVFPHRLFNYLYLSNVLDWLCWHYPMSARLLHSTFVGLSRVCAPSTQVLTEHLVTRPTILDGWLKRVAGVRSQDYHIYRYAWRVDSFSLNSVVK